MHGVALVYAKGVLKDEEGCRCLQSSIGLCDSAGRDKEQCSSFGSGSHLAKKTQKHTFIYTVCMQCV